MGEKFMKLGIAYDTEDMYNFGLQNKKHFDFAELASINILKNELIKLGYNVELLGNTEKIFKQIKENTFSCDLVYNTVEGLKSRNREGLLPALLEINKIPYIGTDSFGLSLTLDKRLTKILAKHLGILTPNFCMITKNLSENKINERLKLLKCPLILKPNFEGNSSGIVFCKNYKEAFSEALRLVSEYETPILCEEFILGKEITVPIIGNDADNWLFGITTVDIQKSEDFWLDLDAKLYGDYKNVILDVSEQTLNKFKHICFTLFNAIGCHDFARFDFRMTKNNKIYFIESNPLPSLFIGGSFDIVGQQHGYNFGQTLDLIIDVACKRLSIPKI